MARAVSDKQGMGKPGRGRKRKRKPSGDDERLDIWGVRFDSVPLPSGMFTHRQAKVIILAPEKRRKKRPD